MKTLHYFDKDQADPDDHQLNMAIKQGYVPNTCLLAGAVVMSVMKENKDPCEGCACDRSKCHGRNK